MQCFTRKQTCNGEYTKHCTRSRHQLKMATPAEVSKRRSNFRIKQFKEKRHFNIAANLTLNRMVSFIILLIVRTASIPCADRHTHTHTQDDYCNPRCACAPKVNKKTLLGLWEAILSSLPTAIYNTFRKYHHCTLTHICS